MRTFMRAASSPAFASSAPTPASEAEFRLPVTAACSASSSAWRHSRAVVSGTAVAFSYAVAMAAARADFSSSVPFGRRMAASTPSKDFVSSSTAASSAAFRACARSASAEEDSHADS